MLTLQSPPVLLLHHGCVSYDTFPVVASLGSPSVPSTACLPTVPGALVFLPRASPSVLTPLSLVAGSLRLSPPPPWLMSDSTPPEPTLTLVASAEFQSEATGGSSGRGRFA